MDNHCQSDPPNAWTSPATSSSHSKSQQALQYQEYQHPYQFSPPLTPPTNQVSPTQYYHVDHQPQHVAQPLSQAQSHLQTSSWSPMTPFPQHGSYLPSEYPPCHYPFPPPIHLPYGSSGPTQQPSPSPNGFHTGSLKDFHHAIVTTAQKSSTTASTKSGVLRGPPRKPRQSHHALWVGNLPFSTDITKLKEHFSVGATATIVSVFWISKSKSAFVNYQTGEALLDAQTRFHNSKFEGIRLVCRARKADIPIPVPAPFIPRPGNGENRGASQVCDGPAKTENCEGSSLKLGKGSEVPLKAPADNNAKKRFFVMKSLTKEDLEASVKNGRWITQEHNETALNEAFACAEDVYLIFSVNKSGEYFGYARMQHPITVLPPEVRHTIPAESIETADPEMPEIVFTPKTECAPEGAIFIDAYRGTIFWEANMANQDGTNVQILSDTTSPKSRKNRAGSVHDEKWTLSSPFEIRWMSTTRLPFYRTRGLKNPWNANQDVKVARDGTELETNVGIRILDLFHQNKLPVYWAPSGGSV